ncbi:hypothetical protein [Saccharopolyspora mangrovi]|uniref:ABC transporter permease n=1 Tax=Saccharopolyspora mangrovi TaxID=3082379 RepID=A0ABU6A7K3_9PSEU|nr:hypothetical protein [Saccharopolyspora sp. S2-29]MEB3367542.1 hypothetical protein [Saccharopolyspora sp. S2-29]
MGLVSMFLAVVFGAVGMPWTFGLPTVNDPRTFIVTGMIGLSSLFLLLIGALTLAGRSSVKTGQLNMTSCRNLRRAAFAYWMGAVVTSGFGAAMVALMVVTSAASILGPPAEFDGEILSFLAFLAVPGILGGVAWGVMLRTLRP